MEDGMCAQDSYGASEQDERASLRPAARAYEAVFTAAATGTDLNAVADVVVDALTSSLGLESARLYLLEGEGRSRALRLLADSSGHSVLALDMPPVPVDGDSVAARVVNGARAEFVEDTHGLRNGGLEQVDGVSRWKLSVGRQAHATLPLIVHGQVRGVLGVDWSAPHDFDATERSLLEGLALAVALAVSSFHVDGGAPVTPLSGEETIAGRRSAGPVAESVPTAAASPSAAAGLATAQFLVKDSGALAPASGVPWGGASVARVSVAWSREPAGHRAATFWDVFPFGEEGSIALVLGTIESSVDGAPAQAALARAALRAAVEQGADVGGVLATLGKRTAGEAAGVCWTSATVALLQGRGTVLESYYGGECFIATLRSDGRMVVGEPGSVPLGATVLTALSSRTDLLLPGDRVALCCGALPAASDGLDPGDLATALARSDGDDGALAVTRVLGPATGGLRPAAAVVLDMLDRP